MGVVVREPAPTERYGGEGCGSVVEAYLRGLGAGVGASPRDILAHLRGRWPKLAGQGVHNFLRELEAAGRVERVALGVWRARTAVNGYAP